MAVIQTQESNGLLSALGAIGTIGGAAFGVPWLSALGMGANMMNGGGIGAGMGGYGGMGSYGDTMKEILDQISGIWKNPASGSIAKTSNKVSQAANQVVSPPTDAQTYNNWQIAQMLQNQNRGLNSWQLF